MLPLLNMKYIVTLAEELSRTRDILAIALKQLETAHRREASEWIKPGHKMAIDMILAYEKDMLSANNARAHDGLLPLGALPKGTKFSRIIE